MAITLKIERFLDGKTWTQDYAVELEKGMTVLAALLMVAAADLLEGLLATPTTNAEAGQRPAAPTNLDETPPAGHIPPL